MNVFILESDMQCERLVLVNVDYLPQLSSKILSTVRIDI